MTLEKLNFNIEQLNHSKESRLNAVNLVIDSPEVLPEIIENAFNTNKNHFKYCWWLEFLNRHYLEILCPYIKRILIGAKLLTNDSAIRPIAKIIETFVLDCFSQKPNKHVTAMMTSSVKNIMVELSFQWLISERINVAAKAYSMTSLYHLGKDVKWVHNELYMVVEQNYELGSAAYKARARMILKALK